MVSGTGQERLPGLFLRLSRSISNCTFEGQFFETDAETDVNERSKLGTGCCWKLPSEKCAARNELPDSVLALKQKETPCPKKVARAFKG